MNAGVALPRFAELVSRGRREHGAQNYHRILARALVGFAQTGTITEELGELLDAFDHDVGTDFTRRAGSDSTPGRAGAGRIAPPDHARAETSSGTSDSGGKR